MKICHKKTSNSNNREIFRWRMLYGRIFSIILLQQQVCFQIVLHDGTATVLARPRIVSKQWFGTQQRVVPTKLPSRSQPMTAWLKNTIGRNKSASPCRETIVWVILQPQLCHLLEAECSKQADKHIIRRRLNQTVAWTNSWDRTALGKTETKFCASHQRYSRIHRSQLRFVAYFVTPPNMQ